MKVWIVAIGEPVPVETGFKERLHRAGMLANALHAAGHDVTWWTSGFDHFQKRHIADANTDLITETGFHIRLIKAPGYRENVSLARLHDHARVARHFVKWARMEAERPELIVCSLPTVGLCKASIKLGKAWNVPVVVDIRDLWPDIYTEVVAKRWRSAFRLALTPLFLDCRWVCKEATALMATSEEFVQWGLKRAGRERNAFDTALPFVYPETQFTGEELAEADRFWNALGVLGQGKVVTYIGSLGRQLRLEAMIRCAHRMTARDPSLKFALCGVGENLESYRTLAAGNPAIVLPGWINAAKICVLLQRTSVGFDPMPNRYDFLLNINNKAVEYLAGAVPILSTPSEGTLARLIRQTGTGESVEEENDELLEGALERMLGDDVRLTDMKSKAKSLYDSSFNPTIVYKRLIQHMESMLRPRRIQHD